MREIVINVQHGGFSLSRAAWLRLRELGSKEALAEPDVGQPWGDGSIRSGNPATVSFCSNIPRDCALLVQVVREMGSDAGGLYSSLEIVEIPSDVEWQIDEYDGSEWVAEKHRTWP
jgi:hypothetical protein